MASIVLDDRKISEAFASALEAGAPGLHPAMREAIVCNAMVRVRFFAQREPCTCDPADNPPRPCPRLYAYSECLKAAAWQEMKRANGQPPGEGK
jgi:hypothetical protein